MYEFAFLSFGNRYCNCKCDALSNPISGGRSTSYVKNNFYVRRKTKKKKRKRPHWNVVVLRETGKRGLLNLNFRLPKLRNPSNDTAKICCCCCSMPSDTWLEFVSKMVRWEVLASLCRWFWPSVSDVVVLDWASGTSGRSEESEQGGTRRTAPATGEYPLQQVSSRLLFSPLGIERLGWNIRQRQNW